MSIQDTDKFCIDCEYHRTSTSRGLNDVTHLCEHPINKGPRNPVTGAYDAVKRGLAPVPETCEILRKDVNSFCGPKGKGWVAIKPPEARPRPQSPEGQFAMWYENWTETKMGPRRTRNPKNGS